MAATNFHRAVLDTLQGSTGDLDKISPERLDWAGTSAFLNLYHRTTGRDRRDLIGAIGDVIEQHQARPEVLALLIQIASSLDIAEVEPEVRRLRAAPIAEREPLRAAISNYLSFRQLRPSSLVAKAEQGVNGKTKSSSKRRRPTVRASKKAR